MLQTFEHFGPALGSTLSGTTHSRDDTSQASLRTPADDLPKLSGKTREPLLGIGAPADFWLPIADWQLD